MNELISTSTRDISTTMAPIQSKLVASESQRTPLLTSDESTNQLHRTTLSRRAKGEIQSRQDTANNTVSFHEHKSNDFWSISTSLPAVGYLQITTMFAHLPTISVINGPTKISLSNSSETTGIQSPFNTLSASISPAKQRIISGWLISFLTFYKRSGSNTIMHRKMCIILTKRGS